jgi:hypothetical protein
VNRPTHARRSFTGDFPMLKQSFLVFLALASSGVAAPAFAQSASDEPQTKFIDFGDMLIDGDLQKPEGMFNTERGRARFNSLLNLRRNFLQDIEQSSHEQSLQ